MKNRLKALIVFLAILVSLPSYSQRNTFRQELLDTFVMKAEDGSGELHTGYDNVFIANPDSAGVIIGNDRLFIKVNYISRQDQVVILSTRKDEPSHSCFIIDFRNKKLIFILNGEKELIMYLKD